MYTLAVSLTPEKQQKIKEVAAKQERSMAWIIRKALDEYLSRETKAETNSELVSA